MLFINKHPLPVWVIGEITVGGSGKSPFIVWLYKYLNEKGLKCAIITSGYGGSINTTGICNKNSNDGINSNLKQLHTY